MLDAVFLRSVIESALFEDVGTGDVTTALVVPEDAVSRAVISAREAGVVAGIEVARMVFAAVDPNVNFDKKTDDGQTVAAGQALAVVEGPSRSLLTAERVALNFLQRLSGIATITARFVSLTSGTRAKIVDTRKTTPGLRALEKYAVRAGGGHNHRFGLYDGILIKDNHILSLSKDAAGSVGEAVRRAKNGAPHTLKVEVEVGTLDELAQAMDAGADAVLLDNMDVETIRRAVEMAGGRVVLEASGGVSEKTVAAIAATGVDLISAGALTHSARAMDIGMDFQRNEV